MTLNPWTKILPPNPVTNKELEERLRDVEKEIDILVNENNFQIESLRFERDRIRRRLAL